VLKDTIQPGVYVTQSGGYVRIHSMKTTNDGKTRYWHGAVLSHAAHRGGMQSAWDLQGREMGGNPRHDLVRAYLDADYKNMARHDQYR
jgi:hypothetical protein